MAFHVGQTVWVSWNDRRRRDGLEEVAVSKVGRKWIGINGGHYRFDIETLRVDGGNYSSPGRVYLSKEMFELAVKRTKLWQAFRNRLLDMHTPPERVEDIEQAAKVLGFVLGDKG